MIVFKKVSWRIILSIAIVFVCLIDIVRAEVLTPRLFINGNCVLAEAQKRGKVMLTYDVRSVGGEQLKLYINQLPLNPNTEKAWKILVIDRPYGNIPLNFYDYEAGIYTVYGIACDSLGQPIAQPSRTVTVRYGGDRAVKNYEKRQRELNVSKERKAKVFQEITPFDELPNIALNLKPKVSVIKPGEIVHLRIEYPIDSSFDKKMIKELADERDTKIYWRLIGEGTLNMLSDTEAVYKSPEQGNHYVRVGIKLIDIEDEATIYVTENEDKKVHDL